jgi:hypothetical protein
MDQKRILLIFLMMKIPSKGLQMQRPIWQLKLRKTRQQLLLEDNAEMVESEEINIINMDDYISQDSPGK